MTTRPNRRQLARIARYWGFALDIVHPFQTRYPRHREELGDAALDGLFTAVHRYDAARKVPFEAYARYRIRGAILDKLRVVLRRRERHDEIAILLLVSRGRPIGAELEETESLDRLLEAFPEEDREIVRRWIGGMPFERVAREEGIPPTSLRRRLRETFDRIAKERGPDCTCGRKPS